MEIRIPKMGMSTVEVDISEVYVQNGQEVAPGDPLVRLEAEKASFDLQAETSGTVRDLAVAEGDVRNVGDVICRIEVSV
ncbi:MAG: lipoyl domain-containing protein [Candidatus Dormibacteraceae bacterium]